MNLRFLHETVFDYEHPVGANRNLLRLVPFNDGLQRRVSFEVRVEPKAFSTRFLDRYGNETLLIHVGPPHERLRIEVEGKVETRLSNPFDFQPPKMTLEAAGRQAWPAETQEFLLPSYYCFPNQPVRAFTAELLPEADMPIWDALLHLNRTIHKKFRYRRGVTDVHTRASRLIDLGEGVCQDFAHLFIAACRSLSLPARYVSGYLYEGDPPKPASGSHSWAEVWLPGAGWRGLDPTNGLLAGEDHIRCAVGRDYADVSPVFGYFWGFRAPAPKVRVLVERINGSAS